MADIRRVTIGFEAGIPLSTRVAEDALRAFRDALGSGEWHDLKTEDGSALIYMPKVIYITTDSSEHRVGFGSA